MHDQYILIDFENVQPDMLAGLEAKYFHVVVFLGATQRKIPVETAAKLQTLGDHAEYVRISGAGPNALDFHIAFRLGALVAKDPTAFYFVVSKDRGFDPLIKHINDQKIFACRVKDLSEVPPIKALHARTTTERVAVVATHLAQRGSLRPRSAKTLTRTIRGLFQSKLTEDEASAVVRGLVNRGVLLVEGERVTYSVASSGA